MEKKISQGGKTLGEVPDNVAVAQLEHFGDKLIVPVGMTLPMAKELIERREAYLEEEISFSEEFAYHPYDGAHAIDRVLERTFGWSCAVPTPGIFGDQPPELINVPVSPTEMRKVPWGRFNLPGCEEGWLATGVNFTSKGIVFCVNGVIKRKFEAQVTKIFDGVREELSQRSIYRGKAIKIRFKDDDGDDLHLPTIDFVDLTDVDQSKLMYTDAVYDQINTSLFIPVSRAVDCINNGINVKRGVLLAGTYGTGKTLGAKVAAKLAVESGNTFLYTPHADELGRAIEFAKQYQSPACVIFCEDIDRAINGDRTVKMDDILNVLDGIDTKTTKVIVVLTTNDLECINPAMLRPGRLDAVIEVTPPDAKTVIKLLHSYGDGLIEPTTDLTTIAEQLAGNIPAVIAEVVTRAKMNALAKSSPGTKLTTLSQDELITAAATIKYQVDLLNRRVAQAPKPMPRLEQAFAKIVEYAITNKPYSIE